MVFFALSLTLGAVIFARLIGPDAWLIKGLRGDKPGAVVAFCSTVLCGALIFLLLRSSVSLLPHLIRRAYGVTEADLAAEYPQQLQIWDAIVCLVAFCVPIVTGYMLSVLYRGISGLVKRLKLR